MNADVSELTFRPLTADDLPLLHDWLSRAHVAEWWGGAPASPAEVAADYADALAGAGPDRCYLACEGGHPVGFVQAYQPAAAHHEGWWLDEHDPGVRGVDQFLADADRLGQGLGTAMVQAFVGRLFADPAVTRVQADPDPANRRAIRCYEKAGFRTSRVIDTPDGRALLMYCDRPASTGREV